VEVTTEEAEVGWKEGMRNVGVKQGQTTLNGAEQHQIVVKQHQMEPNRRS